MAMNFGACRFGFWWVHVNWNRDAIFRVRFLSSGDERAVPAAIRRYLRGIPTDLTVLPTMAIDESTPFASIYQAVRGIPYGKTATYGEIAETVGTSARVVGMAMRRNPTPLIVPCHRVVSQNGIGGFSPSVELKIALLALERGKNEIIEKKNTEYRN